MKKTCGTCKNRQWRQSYITEGKKTTDTSKYICKLTSRALPDAGSCDRWQDKERRCGLCEWYRMTGVHFECWNRDSDMMFKWTRPDDTCMDFEPKGGGGV